MSAAAAASAAAPTGDARARLVDYFVEVVADVLPPSSRRASRHGAGECVDDFERRVTFRLPPTDHADFPLPDGVPFFCIPSCLSAASPSAFERKPTFFSFSLTGGDGSRAYGFALHFYDSLAADAWRPRVFCLISHHPFFSLFKEVVSWVFRERTHTSEQRVVESILADASGQRSWFVSPTRRGIADTTKPYRPPPVDTELSRAVSDTTAAATTTLPGPGPGANGFHDEDLVDRVLSQFVLRAECPNPGGRLELAIDGKPFFSYHIHRGNVVHVCGRRSAPTGYKLHTSQERTRAENPKSKHDQFTHSAIRLPQRTPLSKPALRSAPSPGRFSPRGEIDAKNVDDYCFQVLFQCLSLKNVLYIVNCMLLEQRILIHSNHHGLLTPVCEALCALLFPFVWEHVYVPFLPVKLIEYLQAPVPYIMGLHTSSLATKIGADIFSSCVVVHLDKDKVVTPISSRIDDSPVDFVLARLPSLEVDALLRTVEHLVPQPVNGGSSVYMPRGHYTGGSGNNSPLAGKSLSQPSSPLQHVVESLNFCHSRAPSENELEITFGEGPLGITFESTHMRMLAVNHFQPGRQPGTSAVVKTLPRLQNGLPGPAERSGLIRAGSFLVAINGVSTLDLNFEETIDRLRVEKRPVRLRFLNASAPHESACRFAERLQSLSLVSALQIDHSNTLSRWVDAVRGAFAVLFTSIFRDFQRYILIEHTGASPSTSSSPSGSSKRATPLARSPSAHAHTSLRRRRSSAFAFSVTFDHDSFCEASAESTAAVAKNSSVGFLREFTQTQSFMGFVNDSVMGRISHTTTYPQVELFHNCVHLHHEIGDPVVAAEAIALLFERDHTAIETLDLELPLRDARAEAVGVGSTLLSDAHALLSDASRSPVRSPVKAPLVAGLSASSPCKRTSTTRQLEMIICGSLPDPIDPISKESIAASVEAALSASLDTELLTQLDDDPATPEISCGAQSPSKSSTSSARTLTAGHRSESLSSSGSVGSRSVVDDEGANQAPLQKSAGTNKARQLRPEAAPEDPLQS